MTYLSDRWLKDFLKKMGVWNASSWISSAISPLLGQLAQYVAIHRYLKAHPGL